MSYSLCSQKTKDKRERKLEDGILMEASGCLKQFEDIKKPKDRMSGQLANDARAHGKSNPAILIGAGRRRNWAATSGH